MMRGMPIGLPELSALIIAGPNGAGKTTFARQFLAASIPDAEFINVDLIAEQISPGAPELAAMQAGRRMSAAIRDCVARRQSFAVATTLADRSYSRMIQKWQEAGFRVTLWFLRLPSADISIERVAQRVRQGGHYIPDAVVRRRFDAGIANLAQIYTAIVDDWAAYENSGTAPRLLD